MTSKANIDEAYFGKLAAAIEAAGIAAPDAAMGHLHVVLPCGSLLLAQPGFDGMALPWCLDNEDGGDAGEVDVAWTGDLQVDVRLYALEIEVLRRALA
jgi:hypothetical protein